MNHRQFSITHASYRLKTDDTVIAETLAAAAISDGNTWRAFRLAWKEAYKALAEEIRAERKIMRDGSVSDIDRSWAQARRHAGRLAAFNLLVLLEVAKSKRPLRAKVDKRAA